MARGRRKKPDILKKLEGNAGKRALNGDAPIPEGSLKMPIYVIGYAAEVWTQVVDSMPNELYASCDTAMLAAFCVAVGQFREATEMVAEKGLTIVTSDGEIKAHPVLSAQNKAILIISTLGSKLGLDPASRSSLKMPPAIKASSKFAGLMGEKQKKGE